MNLKIQEYFLEDTTSHSCLDRVSNHQVAAFIAFRASCKPCIGAMPCSINSLRVCKSRFSGNVEQIAAGIPKERVAFLKAMASF